MIRRSALPINNTEKLGRWGVRGRIRKRVFKCLMRQKSSRDKVEEYRKVRYHKDNTALYG